MSYTTSKREISIPFNGSQRQVIIEKEPENEYDQKLYLVEAVDLSMQNQGEDEQKIQQISSIDYPEDEEQDINDLDQLIAATKKQTQVHQPQEKQIEAKTVQRLQLTDDFIRNFLIRHQLLKTLETFQQEWYELLNTGQLLNQTMGNIPDIYIKNQKNEIEIQNLRDELMKARLIVDKVKLTFEKLRQERDFHQMHHQRIQQEKKKLTHDIERLKEFHTKFESQYQELSQKYSHSMKEQMLYKLERDRLMVKTDSMQQNLQSAEERIKHGGISSGMDNLTGSLVVQSFPKLFQSPQVRDSQLVQSQSVKKLKDLKGNVNDRYNREPGGPNQIINTKLTPYPSDDRPNPFTNLNFEPQPYRGSALFKTFQGHMMSVSSVAMHPKKSIVATASDDFTWKLWTIPHGDLIMSGEGHKDWVSGIVFHPRGSHLATSSGDCTIKVWDFLNASCTHTFKDHAQPVWSVDFNDTGEFLVSSSMDHTARVYDLNAAQSRHCLRGHVDSINNTTFQPFTNIIATGSADQTISLWDLRSGLCVQTFYGHLNAVNSVKFNLQGDILASCDSDGIVQVWDIRMGKGKHQYDAGPYSGNGVSVDQSGTMVACASDEGVIKIFNLVSNQLQNTLKGHEGAVQDVAFDYNSKYIVSCGSDNTFRVWN